MKKKLVVTGGYGFIGSCLIRHILNNTDFEILNIDNLTYAANKSSLEDLENNSKYSFEKIDISDPRGIDKVFKRFDPDAIMHLAAESHVDNSINSSKIFIDTNIIGTYNLLEAARKLNKDSFIFHHISTDEVYGDLLPSDDPFSEENRYVPSSPYSASKASSDHLVRAWYRTYGLPVLITNCSNNFGPYQNREKLIPTVVLNAIKGMNIPIYGDGKQIRDWLYVEDHCEALLKVITEGDIGETYNIGGNNEVTNLELIELICNMLENICPNMKHKSISKFSDLIEFVDDRPGHDQRYAIDSSKIKESLGWEPKHSFKDAIDKTIKWYIRTYEGEVAN